jgi:hypothetical protein
MSVMLRQDLQDLKCSYDRAHELIQELHKAGENPWWIYSEFDCIFEQFIKTQRIYADRFSG